MNLSKKINLSVTLRRRQRLEEDDSLEEKPKMERKEAETAYDRLTRRLEL